MTHSSFIITTIMKTRVKQQMFKENSKSLDVQHF